MHFRAVDVYDAGGQAQRGVVTVSVSDAGVYVYVLRDRRRAYWVGSRTGRSAAFRVAFSDGDRAMRVQRTRVVFRRPTDYARVRAAFQRHGYLVPPATAVRFEARA